MKKIILIIPVFLIGLSVFAEKDKIQKNDEIDTTKIKIGKSTLIIINNADDEDYDFDFNNPDAKEDSSDWGFYFDLGMTGYMAPDYEITLPEENKMMELNYSKSWAIGFTTMHNGFDIVEDRLYISPGFGVTWNNYFFENNINILTTGDTTAFVMDSVINYNKYRLTAMYVQVPLVIGVKIGNLEKPLGMQFGVIGSYKVGSKIKAKYTFEHVNYKEKMRDDFNINPFKLEAIVRLSIGDIGVYARYSFTTLFEANKAPEMYPYSIGITFGDFSK